MPLRSIYNQNKKIRVGSLTGFTLIELLVVLALFSVVAGFGLFMSLNAYRGFLTRNERSAIVALLQLARSHAMNHVDGTPWGVCLNEHAQSYVLFAGTAYSRSAARNEPLPVNGSVHVSGLPACANGGIVFAPLAGTTTPTQITLIQGGRRQSISINYEGAIK